MEHQTTLDATSTKLDALNRRLPKRLQPDHSDNLGAEIERLANLGWTPDLLAAYILADCGPQAGTGVVVQIIRGITGPPAATATGHTTWQGHTTCPDGHKGIQGQDCELCHCDPTQNPAHHIKTDPWQGWPDLDLKPADYGPGWLAPHSA